MNGGYTNLSQNKIVLDVSSAAMAEAVG